MNSTIAKALALQIECGVAIAKAVGEGSRGGHVIGHTKSGKPIYRQGFPKNYTRQDHLDARAAHYDRGDITSAKMHNEHINAVGYTKSGKPIQHEGMPLYDTASEMEDYHSNFTSQDHSDAMQELWDKRTSDTPRLRMAMDRHYQAYKEKKAIASE